MSNVKISELPVVTSVVSSDVLPVVASSTTSQLTVANLATSLSNVTTVLAVSGSLIVSGSTSAATSATFQNGQLVLSQVSQSLNFVDDTAAAAGGVPLGGLYRNGNFIVIRIS